MLGSRSSQPHVAVVVVRGCGPCCRLLLPDVEVEVVEEGRNLHQHWAPVKRSGKARESKVVGMVVDSSVSASGRFP